MVQTSKDGYSVNRELVDDTNNILYDKDKKDVHKSSRIGESPKH